MIRKTPQGYVIFSESGRKLSKPYPSLDAAKKRLHIIESFKKLKK